MHINEEAQRGLLLSRVTPSVSRTLSPAAGPGCAEHGAAQTCASAWLLAASICTASPSRCSSGDEDGEGFVSPSLVTGWAHRKTGYKASTARCPACSMLGEVTLVSPALPCTVALLFCWVTPGSFLWFQWGGPSLPLYGRTDTRAPRAVAVSRRAGSSSTRGWREMCFCLPGSSFSSKTSLQEKRTR